MFLFYLKRFKYSTMAARTFSFSNYDCIGLDLDHTISLYKLDNLMKLQYNLLADFLVKKGFDRKIFSSNLSRADVDFIQRGLFLDFKRGNILKIGYDGTIINATHGTKKMTESNLTSTYGQNKRWKYTDKFVTDTMSTWDEEISDHMRSMLEYFDCQVPLVFGKMIDYVDEQNSGKSDEYSVWPIILEGIIAMFEYKGGFYEALYENPELYLRKCSTKIIQWLNCVRKEKKLLFLITGSRVQEATFLGNYCLGEDWKNYFDIIVYQAKKPRFFAKNRPFIESEVVFKNSKLELTQGNWKQLYSIISDRLSISNPKCVYIGDNLIQDIYATSLTCGIDSVAVIEEIAVDSVLNDYLLDHPYGPYLKSSIWGSYLVSDDGITPTIWGSIMKKHSKFHVSSLDCITCQPINHNFKKNWPDTNQLS